MSGSPTRRGTVYLVGAGPGHPGLITRMGYELLQKCDAVAYDALIPLELIAALPQRVERHYVGRRSGRHSMPQTEKNRLLVEIALRGLDVVRLKGGDTSFFAGTTEEVECLAAAGIQVVVVPGVTAASAVAAAAGLAITDRRTASWTFFATGHGSSCDPIPVPWREIATLSGGTIVIYMGLANLEYIVRQLTEGGTPPDTPCMVVQCASTGIQRSVETTLREVTADCRRRALKPPALVVIGAVVRHKALIPQAAESSLAGKRVLVTSCAQETEALCRVLRDRGAEPLPYPTFALEEVDDVEGWAAFHRIAEAGGWCVFANEAEVHGFVHGLLRHGLDLRTLSRFRIAALGGRTAEVLLERGLKADLVSHLPLSDLLRHDLGNGSGSNSGGLVTMLAGSGEVALETESAVGWTDIIRLRLYRTVAAEWEPHWVQELTETPPDFIVFQNGMAVDGFVDLLGNDQARRLASQSKVVCVVGPAIPAAEKHGMSPTATIQVETAEGTIAAMESVPTEPRA